ncbi:MAG: hypothetical protein HY673_20865 [Chloroflexi bacterium]|nr:hypothetical protein [Chloroflexota bacterium]
MTIVADAGPLLSFSRAQRLDVLRDVVGAVVIPEAVYNKTVIRGAGKIGAHDIEQAPWITRQHVQDRSFLERLPVKLHIGEREALALARELNGVLLVDEREVRREARHIGIAYMDSRPPAQPQ